MNQARRKSLMKAKILLNGALDIIREAQDKEQNAMDNYPENLQGTQVYETMETSVDTMEEAASLIDEALDSLEQAASLLEEII